MKDNLRSDLLPINPITEKTQPTTEELSRRTFLKLGGVAGLGASLAANAGSAAQITTAKKINPFEDLGRKEATILELQAGMASGVYSSKDLVNYYLQRIRKINHTIGLDAVLQINPDAKTIAQALDDERTMSGARGPLHGIPILLKDNIDTGDQMMTTAGSLALVGDPAPQDATVVDRLRAAGAIILGKANLSEWANFRGFGSTSGWSGVGGQCKNPFILDRNPCGSSSGSAAAVSANLCAAALGTETDGSVVCPASACGVVGIKPTVGLTSRAGVVPISDTQDTVGIHGRAVADAAAVLGSMTGVDARDPKTQASAGNSFTDYTQFLDNMGLAGSRIGVVREFSGFTEETSQVFEMALQQMRDGGAQVIDITIPSFNAFNSDSSEITVLIFEFKRDLNAYLATRTGVPIGSLAELIQFNLDNFEKELQFFGQQFLEFSEGELFTDEQYQVALEVGPRLAGAMGIDATLADFNLDALVAPTNSPAWPSDLITGDCFQFGTASFAAVAGYPMITVPAGNVFGLPLGVSFFASAWSEPTLIKIASGFEAISQARIVPTFRPTLIKPNRFPPFKRELPRGQPTPRQELQRAIAPFLKPFIRKPFYL